MSSVSSVFHTEVTVNKKGANMNSRTMEYGWRQNKDYAGGATC